MYDKFTSILLEELAETGMGMSKETIKEDFDNIPDMERFVPVKWLIDAIKRTKEACKSAEQLKETEKKHSMPKTKFLYVEDGSVDLDDLEDELFRTNPEIKIILYRQGSCPPIFIDKGEEYGK